MSDSEIPIMKHMYDRDRQFYVAHLKMNLEKGKQYKIAMNFIGYLNDNLDGFYRSSYTDDQGKKR